MKTYAIDVEYIRCFLDYDAENGLLLRKDGSVACFVHRKGYRAVCIMGKTFGAHRVCWALHHGVDPEKALIDHANRDAADNRIGNLRKASYSQNAMNRGARSDSLLKIKGVSMRRGKYRAQISIDGKKMMLGTFDNADDAHAAYCRAASAAFGEFASHAA